MHSNYLCFFFLQKRKASINFSGLAIENVCVLLTVTPAYIFQISAIENLCIVLRVAPAYTFQVVAIENLCIVLSCHYL